MVKLNLLWVCMCFIMSSRTRSFTVCMSARTIISIHIMKSQLIANTACWVRIPKSIAMELGMDKKKLIVFFSSLKPYMNHEQNRKAGSAFVENETGSIKITPLCILAVIYKVARVALLIFFFNVRAVCCIRCYNKFIADR